MKIFKSIIACAVCLAVFSFTPLVAYKKTTAGNSFPVQTPEHKLVLTIWNVDLFEGGIGSRTDFLNERFLEFGEKGVLALTKSHTKESAENALKKGETPDVLSFGVGLDGVAQYALELPKTEFLGGEYGGKIYAYPWCVGGYFLIRKTNENQPIERLYVSQNNFNLPYLAIENEQIEAREVRFEKPLDAYVEFLAGGNANALLGTQRDIKRLESRKATFYAQSLGNFSDIVQYVAILTKDELRYEKSLKFVQYLTGEKAQKKLVEIGMQSPFFNVYDGEELFGFDFKKIRFTVSPFTESRFLTAIIDELKVKTPTNDSLLRLKSVLKRL